MSKAKEKNPAKPEDKKPQAPQTQTQPGDDGAKGLNASTAGAGAPAPAAGATSTPTAQDGQAGDNTPPAGGEKRIYGVRWRLLRNGEEYLPGRTLALTDAEAKAIGSVLELAPGEVLEPT